MDSKVLSIRPYLLAHLIRRNVLAGADGAYGFAKLVLDDYEAYLVESSIYMDAIETHKLLLDGELNSLQLEIITTNSLPLNEKKLKLIDIMEKMEDLLLEYEMVYG